MDFSIIAQMLDTTVSQTAQKHNFGQFKFRLEMVFLPPSKEEKNPSHEWGTLQVKPDWFRQLDALHIEYSETGLEVVRPRKFHLFFICETGRIACQHALDELYDALIEVLQDEGDLDKSPVVQAAFACFSSGSFVIELKE